MKLFNSPLQWKQSIKNRFLCAALAFPWLKELILRSPFLSSLFKMAIIQYLCLLHLCPAGLKWHTLECSYHENKVNNGSWIMNSKRSWYDSVKCQVFTTESYEKPCYLSVIYSNSIDWWSFKFFCSFPIKVLKFSMKCQISYCMPFRDKTGELLIIFVTTHKQRKKRWSHELYLANYKRLRSKI